MISVLLVEDNSDLMAATRSYLEKSGDLRVDIAHSHKHAIEKLKVKNYDVIVSYYQIPSVNGIEFMTDMNGVELLKFLKAQGNATPFLLFNQTRPDRVTVTDLINGTEFPPPREGESRSPLAELVNMIKQAVLRKKAERDLRNQNDLLQSILSATPLGICLTKNRVIEWVNPGMSAIFGYQDSSLTGKQVSIISPGREETERILRELMICIDDAGWGYANAELVKKDGTAFSAHLQTRPVDRKDPLKGEVLVITDMTGKKRLEDALKESEFRYRELQQNTSSIILRIDPHGTITFFNKYAQSFFDYAPEAVIGKNVVGTIVPAKGRSGHDQTAAFTDIGFSQDGYAIAIHENMRRNGDRVWVAWTKKAVRDESGHVAEILCIGNDITDHRKADEVRISTDSWREQVIADTDIKEDVFDAVFHVCAEISLEGREGKPVGTAFLLGDVKNVLENSRQLILNPFEGHKPETRMITNYDLKENIKEIAQLDGAFVISGDGVIEAAGRHITIDTSAISIPKGMGTRHSSVAGITQATNAIGIVVSQSGGRISIFKNGKIVKVISL